MGCSLFIYLFFCFFIEHVLHEVSATSLPAMWHDMDIQSLLESDDNINVFFFFSETLVCKIGHLS